MGDVICYVRVLANMEVIPTSVQQLVMQYRNESDLQQCEISVNMVFLAQYSGVTYELTMLAPSTPKKIDMTTDSSSLRFFMYDQS